MRNQQYRRGTVMGLTLAEVFLLLVFILLLLIALWRAAEHKKNEDFLRGINQYLILVRDIPLYTLEQINNLHNKGKLNEILTAMKALDNGARLVEDDDLKIILENVLQFSSDDRQKILELVSNDKLIDKLNALKAIDEGARVVEDKDLKKILENIQQFSVDERQKVLELVSNDKHINILNAAHAIDEGARLVEKQDLKQLIDNIEKLPKIKRQKIIELINSEGLSDVIAWAHELGDQINKGRKPSDILNALALIDTIPPEEFKNIDLLKKKIRQRIEDSESVGRDVATAVQKVVGTLIDRIGGEIDPNSGAIILPDTALFSRGSAALNQTTQQFLDQFCRPWVNALSSFGDKIGSLRIEGHASTEWGLGISPHEAYLKNMDLSQRRASAVLEYCLYQLRDDKAREWSQQRLVAVGFSSAKPILESGRENPEKSRRVVFRTDIDKESILKAIQADVTSSLTQPQ